MRKIGIMKAEVDATRIIEDSEDYLVVPAIIGREGVFEYPEGMAYKPADELKEAAWTAEGAWIVAEKHPDTLILTNPGDIKGRVEDPEFCSDINGIPANLRFFKKRNDPQFLADIKTAKKKDVSIGFFYDFDPTPGEFKGTHYDFVQRNILINHVAAGVPVGRCTSPFCGIAVDQMIRKPMLFPLVEIRGTDEKEIEDFLKGEPFKNLRSKTFFFPKVAVDPEETEDYIHVPVRDADDFVDESFRTIDIDADKGIKAVIGKLKSDPDGSTHVQKFLFAKDKDWTMEKAKAWVEEREKAADAVEMTLEQIKQKIMDLSKKQAELQNRLWPPPQPHLTDEERLELESQLGLLTAETEAYRKLLEEKIATKAKQQPETDAQREIERSRRLLGAVS